MEKYYDYSLEKIKEIKDKIIKAGLLKEYLELFESLKEPSFIFEKIESNFGDSMNNLYSKWLNLTEEYRSEYYFPDDFVSFYPSIKEYHTKKVL